MNEYNQILISVILLAVIVGCMYYIDSLDNDSPIYSLEDTEDAETGLGRVTVDESIIQGYEGEDYIPRSAGINERLMNGK